MARPKKKISAAMVKKLGEIQCTNAEIGAVVGCDESTIRRRFADVVAQGREIGKTSLRRKMWTVGVKDGNVKMLIHLAQQYLGHAALRPVDVRSALASIYEDPRLLSVTERIVTRRAKPEELTDEQLKAIARDGVVHDGNGERF